jgi:hypothetical protein
MDIPFYMRDMAMRGAMGEFVNVIEEDSHELDRHWKSEESVRQGVGFLGFD